MGFLIHEISKACSINNLIKVNQLCTYFLLKSLNQQLFMCEVILSFLQGAQKDETLKLKLKQSSHPVHQYYCCYETQMEGKKMNAFKLIGPANPFIPLLQLYLLFAPPTINIITRQFVLFTIRCWRVYQKFKYQEYFKQQFYSFCLPQNESKPIQNGQINKLIDKIMNMNKDELIKLQEQAVKNIQYQPQYLKQSKLNVKDFGSKQLNNLAIIPQAAKYRLLKYFTQNFTLQWGIRLLFDKSNNNFYIIAEPYTNSHKVVTIEQFIYLANCQELQLASLQQIQEVYFSVCKRVDVFNSEIDLIFSSEAPQIQIPYYHPSFTNVFTQIEKTNQGYILGKRGCLLDYLQPVFLLVGLKNKPMTLENYLLFYSTPNPYTFHFDFTNVLKYKFPDVDDKILEQSEITIKWLLICDHLLVKVLKEQGQSALQKCASKKAIIEQIFGQRKYLHPQTKAIIDLLQLGGQQKISESSLLYNLKLSKIDQISKYDNAGIFEEQKYGLIKSSIDFQNQLFFQNKEGLKYFGQKCKLQHFTPKLKYICLYLFAKYAQLYTQVQFLQLWTGEQVNLLDPKYQINKNISKFITVCDKIKTKLKPSNDQTNELLRNSNKIYQTLIETTLPFQFKNSQYENRKAKIQAINTLLKQIKYILDLIFAFLKTEISKIQESDKIIYLAARKNVCYKQMFLNLTFFNYSSLICQQIAITEFKPSIKEISRNELQQTFDKFDREIQQMVVGDKHFFSQTNPLSHNINSF